MSEDKESHIKEMEEGRIIDNVHLLELRLVDSYDDIDDEASLPEVKSRLLYIKKRGSYQHNGKWHESIQINYDTKTGEIGVPSNAKFLGDYSALNTDLVTSDERFHILLYRPGNTPSAAEYASAFAGEQYAVPVGNRRIYPERKSPEHPDLQGVEEDWGQSKVVDSASGDLIMLKSIRKFNEKYGPDK